MARWGEPLAAVKRLTAALPSDDRAAFEAIQEMLETLRGPGTPDVLQARAMALELLADRSSGNQRVSFRLDAARAYADAGDQSAARRMLAGLAGDPAATPAMAASASSTLISVLVDEDHLAEADRRFAEIAPHLGADDRERLALRLAEGWIRNGRLGRADSLLAADSSVDALAVRGRIALYRGDLGTASTLLAEAGPFTGERADATGRIGLLGLLQLLESDSLPALGEALYKLERRDSAAAAAALEKVAQSVGPEHGGAELLLLAGRVRAGLGQSAEAERLYRAAVTQGVPAGSAAAELALAELLLREGKNEPAVAALEHLLLTWPTSAVVPQARRLLDVARGAVPSA
jgi:outer membrane PBP1 activator LpoA protein